MSKRQSPQPKVGSGVRDGTQHVLDGMNGLVHPNLRHRFFFLFFVVVSGWTWSSWNGGVRAGARRRRFVHLETLVDIPVGFAIDLRFLAASPRTDDEYGLAQEHDGDANQGAEDQQFLHDGLSFEHVNVAVCVRRVCVLEQHHVDEVDEH